MRRLAFLAAASLGLALAASTQPSAAKRPKNAFDWQFCRCFNQLGMETMTEKEIKGQQCVTPAGKDSLQKEFCDQCGWKYVNTGSFSPKMNYCLVE